MTDSLKISVSKKADGEFLSKWLMDPIVLSWFPLDNQREVDDAVRIWLGYDKAGATFTGYLDGKPVGMAVLYLHHFKKVKHQTLFAIIVDKEQRGKGVGSKIFAHMKDVAKDKFNIELLHLEVYDGNPAYNLYKKLGFEEFGRQKGFLKESSGNYRDKINMQMFLG